MAQRPDFFLWTGVTLALLAAYDFYRNQAAASSEAGTGTGTGTADNPITQALNAALPMDVSPSGQSFIKSQEGFAPTRHNDAGHQAIGYGHDIVAGDDIPARIDRSQANNIFLNDMARVAGFLQSVLKVSVTQNQFDALASLAYNIGFGAFRSSTLLRLLNQGNYRGAAAQFPRWNQSAGRVDDGLVRRRRSEQQLFNS